VVRVKLLGRSVMMMRREKRSITQLPGTDSGVGPISSRGLEIFLLSSFYRV
jgi:hypothetical protein